MDEVRRVARLAWPVVVGQLGLMAMGVVDLLMVGRLGETATAAVGIGNTWSFALMILGQGAASGIDPLVAQAYGRGDPRGAGTAAWRGSVMLAGLAVVLVALHLAAEPALRLLGQPEQVVPWATTYAHVVALSVVPYLGFSVLRQLLQGGGAMRPAMWAVWIANGVNVLGNAVLIDGWGPVPALGVAGVATSTVVVRWFLVGALVLIGWPILREAWPTSWRVSWRELVSLAWVALPVGLQMGIEVWAFNAAAFLAGMLGATQLAAHTATISISAVAFMVPLGLSAAAATRVGNLVGAGRPWQRSAWTSIGLGAAVMTVSALVFVAMPHPLARAFSPDGEVVALVVATLPLAAAFQWTDGTQVVAFGVLRGVGDTRVPMLLNVLAHWAIGVPVGVWLAFGRGWGLAGIWTGLIVGLSTISALLLVRVMWLGRRGQPVAQG